MCGIFTALALVQIWLLLVTGNGVAWFGDAHSEADNLRSAEGYAKHGLWSHHGLPRLLYGKLFPSVGTVVLEVDGAGQVRPPFRNHLLKDQENPDEWVYTHYPPGPNLVLGLEASLLGMSRIWLFRLLPIAIGLAATGIFFKSLLRTFGKRQAIFLALACAVLPMFSTCTGCLHYEGYATALILIEMALLMRLYREAGQPAWPDYLALAALGLLQGCMSFDQLFIVSLLPLPFWVLRRHEGRSASVLSLFWLLRLPGERSCWRTCCTSGRSAPSSAAWPPLLKNTDPLR